jgi:hypothetical protein
MTMAHKGEEYILEGQNIYVYNLDAYCYFGENRP